MKWIILLGFVWFLTSSCSQLPAPPQHESQNSTLLGDFLGLGDGHDEPITFVSKRSHSSTKLIINKKTRESIDRWITYFSTTFRPSFQEFLNNGEPYRSMVERILAEHQVPKELYYLPIIESGYQLKALSRAGAMGPWQFIRSTGRRYGLNVNHYIDERRHIVKATQAAAAHLRDLHNIFGSWELALAAYNAGINRITGLILKGSNREYWKLSELGLLPKETRQYIPKFLAAVMIGEDPEKYGFTLPQIPSYEKSTASVEVPSGLKLKDVAQAMNISYRELRALNPELRRSFIPHADDPYELTVPAPHRETFRAGQGILAKLVVKPPQRTRPSSSSPTRSSIYIVRKGDHLGKIARRYRLSVRQIKGINGLRSSRIYPGQRLRVSVNQGQFYIVQRGDTLWDIAQTNNLSLRQLINLNHLKTTRIYAGQKLVVNK